MKKFKDLTAADFPGIDAQKFQSWKAAIEGANVWTAAVLIGLVLLNIILYVTTGSIALGGLVLLLVFVFIWRKPNRLGKELGMTRQRIKEARSR
jgi:hypothetical protein